MGLGGNVKQEAMEPQNSTPKNLQLIPELLMKFWYPGSKGGRTQKQSQEKNLKLVFFPMTMSFF